MNKKKFLLILTMFLVIIQFIPTDKTVPKINPKDTFVTVLDPPETILKQLKNACYDCHSYETIYPWYTYVAPVSFWINAHIRNGRKALNFSTWNKQSISEQKHLLYECAEEIAEGHMPPKGYYRMHKEAYLDESEKEKLQKWLYVKSEL